MNTTIQTPTTPSVSQFDTDTTFNSKSLRSAFETLQKLKAKKCDVVLPIQDMEMTAMGDVIVTYTDKEGIERPLLLSISDTAHRQISGALNIPLKYWRKCVESRPASAAYQFNDWLKDELERKGADKTRRRLIRAYWDNGVNDTTGVMRALLSDRYLTIDNLSFLTVAMEAAAAVTEERKKTDPAFHIVVEECNLSQDNLYVRFNCPTIKKEAREALENYRDPNGGEFGGVGRDFGITTGFVISNSEVGSGKASIAPLCLVRACKNNMIWKSEAFSRTHLGGKVDEGFFSEETKQKNIELIKGQINDAVTHMVGEEFLGKMMSEIEAMAGRKISHPVQVMGNLATEWSLSDYEAEGIMEAFLKGGSTGNAFDVVQAVTAYAHKAGPDRRYELECKSVTIMDLIDQLDKPAE